MSPVTMINKWYVAVEYKENHCDRFGEKNHKQTKNYTNSNSKEFADFTLN